MNERCYDIHGLVEVLISREVRPEIVQEIEFQIGPLRVHPEGRVPGRPSIQVRPYAEKQRSGGLPEAAFYQCQGLVGSYLTDEEARLCVCRGPEGFTIFADYANFLINLYIQLLLVPQGYSMVHAAAYKDKVGKVTLLTGAGGIGKTAVLGHVVRAKGFQHLGDDIVILGGKGDCLAFPRAFVLKSYHREGYAETFERLKLPRWNLSSAKRFLIQNAPFVALAKDVLKKAGLYYTIANLVRPHPYLAAISSEQLFGHGSMATSGEVIRIVYLDRVHGSEFHVQYLSIDTCANRVFAVIHYEWKEFLAHLISLGALDVVQLSSYYEQVVRTLTSSLTGKELMHVQVPISASSDQLIAFLEANGIF